MKKNYPMDILDYPTFCTILWILWIFHFQRFSYLDILDCVNTGPSDVGYFGCADIVVSYTQDTQLQCDVGYIGFLDFLNVIYS